MSDDADAAKYFHSTRVERSADILKRNDKSHGLSRTWIKTERDVEFSRLLRNGMDHDSSDSDCVRGLGDAAGRILKQRAS